jgi:hypothetical protein
VCLLAQDNPKKLAIKLGVDLSAPNNLNNLGRISDFERKTKCFSEIKIK